MPNWANWTVSGSLSSTSYTPGGYSGLTGNGSMLYNAQQYGGGVISMTLRIATPGGGDTFYAYLGAGARSCPELRCDLRLSAINTLRGSCLDGKSFLNSVVGQGRNQLGDLPISFEASEFAFRQQQS